MPAPTDTTLIDAVDASDQVIGHLARGVAPTSGTGFRTVHVFVRHRGRLLLQRLSSTRPRHPGCWGSSVAGYLHAGESYREAAERRQAEELGLTTPLSERGKIEFRELDAIKFVTLFLTEAADPEILEQRHISELGWWSVAELATNLDREPNAFTPTFRGLFRRFGIGDGDSS